MKTLIYVEGEVISVSEAMQRFIAKRIAEEKKDEDNPRL
jgi:hypothetical protein